MNWLMVFIIGFILFMFSIFLWKRLFNLFDKYGIVYTTAFKKRVLWEIFLYIAELIVAFLIVHWGLIFLDL